jgi:two-component system LytT family response regulator
MLRTVIIDDEAKAIKALELIIKEYCLELEVVGTAQTVIDGIKIIQSLKPDLVMLDIQMNHGNGFDVLESIPDRTFDVIFVTAYDHYAIKAIRYSAVDYILKPIDIQEFTEAIERVVKDKSRGEKNTGKYETLFQNLQSSSPSKLAIPISDGIEYIDINEIIRIEAERSYSNVYLIEGRKLLVSRSLSDLQDLLDNIKFFRTHKSHLINLDHVKKFLRNDGGYVEMADGERVMISRRKKEEFLAFLNEYMK